MIYIEIDVFILIKKGLPLEYTVSIDKFYWEGTAKIPIDYFPMM
jgi:hypothetical protein